MIGAPIVGSDVRAWAQEMVRYLGRAVINLQYLTAGSSATVNGILMWDPATSGVVVSIGGTWVAVGGGAGATNLGYTAATRELTSSTGTDVFLPLVGVNPGLMLAADKTKLDAITGTNTGDQTTIAGISGTKAQFNTAVSDGDIQFVGDAPTAHTHLLAAGATDVTMTAANLNTLDDGVNTALHFHDTDRARGNHTGTQLAATISDFASASRAQTEAELLAGANITITPAGAGATRTLTIAAASGGAGVAGQAIVTVPNGQFEWSETLAAVGVLPGNRIILSVGAHTDADENSAEMLDINAMSGAAGTAQITFDMSFREPTAGAVRLNWSAA